MFRGPISCVFLLLCVYLVDGWKEPSVTPSSAVVIPRPGLMESRSGKMLSYTCYGMDMPSDFILLWLRKKGNIVSKISSAANEKRFLPLLIPVTTADNGTEIFCRTRFWTHEEQIYNVKSEDVQVVVLPGSDWEKRIIQREMSVKSDISLTVTPDSNSITYNMGEVVDHVCVAENLPEHTIVEWWHVGSTGLIEYRQSSSYNGEDFVLRKNLTLADDNTQIYCRTQWLEKDTYFVTSNYVTLHVIDVPSITGTTTVRSSSTTTTTTTTTPTTTTPTTTTPIPSTTFKATTTSTEKPATNDSTVSITNVTTTSNSHNNISITNSSTTSKPKTSTTPSSTLKITSAPQESSTSVVTIVFSTMACITVVILLVVYYVRRKKLLKQQLLQPSNRSAYTEIVFPERVTSNGTPNEEIFTPTTRDFFDVPEEEQNYF